MQEDVFHEVSDEFVNLANDLSDDWSLPLLSAAIMHAAARYNAFNFKTVDGNADNVEEAVRYYTEQYGKMLRENIKQLL